MCSSQKSQENRLQGRGEVKTEHGKHFFSMHLQKESEEQLDSCSGDKEEFEELLLL